MFAADVVLRDGSTVQLRAIHPSDDAGLRSLLGELSPESLYSRFFTIPKSTDAEVARLMCANGSYEYVLVAELPGRLCAVAS